MPNPQLTVGQGALAPWAGGRSQYFARLLESVCESHDIPTDVSWSKLSKAKQKLLLYGVSGRVKVQYRNRYGRTRSYEARFEGVVPYLQRRHSEAESDSAREQVEGYMREVPCPECGGARLRPLSLAVTIDGHNIADDLRRCRSARPRPCWLG